MILWALACAAAGPPPAVPFDPTFADWERVLAHVNGGGYDYPALVADRAPLDRALANFAAPTQAEVAAWPKDRQIAFWIDVYNAHILRTVVEHWPVESIRTLGLVPYTVFRERSFTVRARPEPLSLDGVEKGIVLGELHEPRAHMAFNCASKSCPSLQPHAWSVQPDLGAALDAAARSFLADPTKNRWDPATHTLSLSKIFDWYAGDLGDVDLWIRRYGPPEMVAALAGEHRVVFLDYDWGLNRP